MATVICTVRVRKNGALSLPKRAREELELQPGDEVEIQIRTPGATPAESPRNPLYDIRWGNQQCRNSGPISRTLSDPPGSILP